MRAPVFSPTIHQFIANSTKGHALLKMSGASQDETDTSTVVKSKPRPARPSLYKVILLNDDFTPMEFVVLVLVRHFNKSPQEAERIMMEVHHQGAGLAGIYPFEVAETKVFTVNEFSRRQKHPLKCIMEEQSSEGGSDA